MKEHREQKTKGKELLDKWKPNTQGHLAEERGIFILATGLAIIILFVFTALGIEVGRWYVVRAEMSKSVDAASLLGAKNISNPYLEGTSVGTTVGLMEAVAKANFSAGFFGSEGDPHFIADDSLGEGKVSVQGSTNVLNKIAVVLNSESANYDKQLVGAYGAAQQRDVEIMMVLDRSGSMSGAIGDLQVAAKSFLDFFEQTQANDEFGLITYSTGITVDFPKSNNFVDDMKEAVDGMVASGWTNTEDAIDTADDEANGGFSDQSGVPGDERLQQFMVFFSDGNPTAFRIRPTDFPVTSFVRHDRVMDDAVAVGSDGQYNKLRDPITGNNLPSENGTSSRVYPTGDGIGGGDTACPWTYNTKWNILAHPEYGKHIYPPIANVEDEQCGINEGDMADYVDEIGKKMAIEHAQELKDQGIKIYTVGLGDVDQDLLAAIATGPAFEYYTPDSEELKDLFQQIATNIKLRLIH